jgi:hypothetical protein
MLKQNKEYAMRKLLPVFLLPAALLASLAATLSTQPAKTINVLYIESTPRWEFRHVKSSLIAEPTVNLTSILINADPGFEQEADPRVVDKDGKETFPGPLDKFPDNPDVLNKYDVLIIGDVDASRFTPDQQKLIVDFVTKHGGGIAFIAGPSSNPQSYRKSLLDPLLPIIFEDPPAVSAVTQPANEPFHLKLTEQGQKSPIFKFLTLDTDIKQMDQLPQMYWYRPLFAARKDAITLAVHSSVIDNGQPHPLVVSGQNGKGHTFFCGVCDTWRWRRNAGQPLFDSYWLELCRSLAPAP